MPYVPMTMHMDKIVFLIIYTKNIVACQAHPVYVVSAYNSAYINFNSC